MKKQFFFLLLFCWIASSPVYAQIIPPGQALTGYGSSENYISDTFSSHESGLFEDGTQLFYYIPDILKNGASAPAVIFLHGMFATIPPFQQGNGYSEHLTHVLRQGYIVIYPQFNTAYDPDQNVMLDRCIASTEVALAAIGSLAETDNLVLYGHSVGGILSVCWEGAGGVPVKALVTAQGNMNPCVAGLPDWVCPLITKLDYQTLAPSMTCPAILLWGDADTILAPWSHQLDAFNSLTNVSSKIIYTAQSDDYGDPDLAAGHGAPNSPIDTLDYRYYWAALDAALDDQTVVNFDMGLWSDGTPVKPVLEYECTEDGDCAGDDVCSNNICSECTIDGDCDNGTCIRNMCVAEGSLQIGKCTVKAGKNGKGDSIKFSGSMDVTADDLNPATGGNIVVGIEADALPNTDLTTFLFPVEEDSLKKGNYKSPKVKPVNKTDPVTSLQIDTSKGTIKFSGKNLNLTGLSCPITLWVQVEDYFAEAVLDEDIVNGPKKLCPSL